MPVSRQCQGKTRTGERCGAYALSGSAYCLHHDPGSAKARARRNKRGGRSHKAKKPTAGMVAPRMEGIGDVLCLINAAILDCWELDNTVPRVRALLAAAECATKTLEIGELEERIAKLEARQ